MYFDPFKYYKYMFTPTVSFSDYVVAITSKRRKLKTVKRNKKKRRR
jgi:hypothetical protein